MSWYSIKLHHYSYAARAALACRCAVGSDISRLAQRRRADAIFKEMQLHDRHIFSTQGHIPEGTINLTPFCCEASSLMAFCRHLRHACSALRPVLILAVLEEDCSTGAVLGRSDGAALHPDAASGEVSPDELPVLFRSQVFHLTPPCTH